MLVDDIKNSAKKLIDSWLREHFSDFEIKDGDNLVAKGLSSIQVMQLVSLLRKEGVRVSFSSLMESSTLASWNDLIDKAKVIKSKNNEESKEETLNKKDSENKFDLTDVQYSYFIGRQDDQILGGVGCHAYLEIDGQNIVAERLNDAWNKLQYRHPMLRAEFDDSGQQKINEKPYSEKIEIFDFSNINPEDVEVKLLDIRDRLSHRKLKVRDGQVADLKLAILPEGKTKIFFDIDLLVADVFSMSIIIKELAQIYSGIDLKPLSDYTFRDYLISSNTKEIDQEDKEFWLDKINSFEVETPNIPLTKKPEQINTTIFTRRSKVIDKLTWNAIRENAAKFKTTPSMLLLACYALVLERWCNQEKFFINIPLFNRDLANNNLENMVADFTNLLLVEHEMIDGKSFIDSLSRIEKTFLENVSHSSYSGVQVQRDISKNQGTSVNVAPVVFACNIDYPLETEISRDTLGEITYMISQTPGIWLDFQSYINKEELIICWDSVDELFPKNVLGDMFDSFIELLVSLSDYKVWENKVDVLTENQKTTRQSEVDAILPLNFPEETLYDGFIKNVNLIPDKTAIIDSETGKRISYKELYEISLTVAKHLIDSGVEKGDYIGITLPRGYRQIYAIFGILFAGAVYVPIGIGQPAERRSKIYDQIGIKCVLSDQETTRDCELDSLEIKIVDLDIALSSDEKLDKPIKVDPFDSAYVIMTSGSTGVPKGVEMMHTSSINTCIDLNEKYGIGKDDTVLMVSAIDFDLSVYDIFGLLHAGGTVITTTENNFKNPDEWLKLIDKYSVTIWDSVPILFDMLVTMAEGKKRNLPMRIVMLSGDWIAIDLPGRFYKISEGNPTVVAMGGATEAAIWSNYLNVPRQIPKDWISIPYGNPLKNQVYRVIDELGRICPNYVKGELLIGGVGVAKCYRGDEELTNKKYFEQDGMRWYKTGDNGRTWNDGTIEFLGRKDTQIKIKGHRIELGEIEDAIRKYDGVDSVIVDFIERGESKQLVAFVKSDLSPNKTVDYSSQKNNNFSFIVKPEISSTNEINLQNEEIDKIVIKTIINIFKEYGIDFSNESYSIEEIYQIMNCSDSNKIIVKEWINELEKFNYLISCNERYKKNKSAQELIIKTEDIQAIEEFVREIEPELLDVLNDKKDAIEVFYREDEKFSLTKLVRHLVGYKESLNCIIETLKNYVELNPNKKLRILEYSTRDKEITEKLFNEFKDYIDEYYYVDNSIYFEEGLSNLKENSKFKYVVYKDGLKDLLEADFFDVIITLNSIHRSSDSQRKLRELTNRLKSTGILLGNEINILNLLPLITASILDTENFKVNKKVNIKIDNSEILHESNAEETAETNFNTFIIRKMQNIGVSFNDLRSHLLEEIPSYMVPTYFYHVDEIPLNKNGKADRKRLKKNLYKDQESFKMSTDVKTQARTDREKLLLDIWKEALNAEDIGINDNYFSLGGDSLTATAIVGKVRNEMGIEISIKDIFENSSISSLLKYIDENQEDRKVNELQIIVPDKENLYEPFPLTDVQMAYWVGRNGKFSLNNVSNHCYFEFEILELNLLRLQDIINDVIKQNDMLRAVVLETGEQQILEKTPIYLIEVINIENLEEKVAILEDIRDKLSHQQFNPNEWPLYRFRVTKISNKKYRLHVSFDNIMIDGWSMFYLLDQIFSRYEGTYKSEEHTCEISFRDYVLYTKDRTNEIIRKRDEEYWVSRIKNFPSSPQLPLKTNERDLLKQKFFRRESYIDEEVWANVKLISRDENLTPTIVLITLFSEILKIYSKNENFALNITLFDRDEFHKDARKIVGDFTTLNLLEVKKGEESSIVDNAKILQSQLIKDLEHSSYNAIKFMRDLRFNQENYVNSIMPIVFTSGLGLKSYDQEYSKVKQVYSISQTPQVWLDHQVVEINNKLKIIWDSIDDLFEDGLLDEMFDRYKNTIIKFSQNKNLKINAQENNDQKTPLVERCNKSKTNSESEFLKIILDVWSDILGFEVNSLEKTFFELGGDSLGLVKTVNELKKRTMIDLNLTDIMENCSADLLSKFLYKLSNNIETGII